VSVSRALTAHPRGQHRSGPCQSSARSSRDLAENDLIGHSTLDAAYLKLIIRAKYQVVRCRSCGDHVEITWFVCSGTSQGRTADFQDVRSHKRNARPMWLVAPHTVRNTPRSSPRQRTSSSRLSGAANCCLFASAAGHKHCRTSGHRA